MKKTSLVMALSASLFMVGCTTNPYQQAQVPVIESGSPITSGSMRGSQRQAQTAPQANTPSYPQQQVPNMQWPEDNAAGVVSIPQSTTSGDLETYPANSMPALDLRQQGQQRIERVQQQTGQAIQQKKAELSGPVVALLSSADSAMNKGNLDNAAANLERALRISPREPEVLMRLADLRLNQGNAQQAEQLAQQALNYAQSDSPLAASLWDIVAQAREQLNDAAGAAEARQRARVSL